MRESQAIRSSASQSRTLEGISSEAGSRREPPRGPSGPSERNEPGAEAASGELIAHFFRIDRIHEEHDVGSQSLQRIRAENLAAGAGEKLPMLVRIDVHDRRQLLTH